MEKQLEQLGMEYPDKARGVAKFSVPLAHMITAGADFMLVPSRFEPCGLIQLHAMRYGTLRSLTQTSSSIRRYILHEYRFTAMLLQVPIVASTGGLVDTVKEGFTGFHMGAFNVEVMHLFLPFFIHKILLYLRVNSVSKTDVSVRSC